MRLAVLSALLGVAALGCGKKPPTPTPAPGDPPATPQTDEQKVQGTWKIVGGELPPGDDAPPPEVYAGVRFTVDGTKITFTGSRGNRPPEYFSFKGDPTAAVKTVDFTVADEKGLPIPGRFGPNGDAPERILGIYKFEGDELVLALAVEGSSNGFRPKEFKAELTRPKAKGEDHHMVVVLRLTKADPSEKPVEPGYRPTPGTRRKMPSDTRRTTPGTRRTPDTRKW